MANRSYLYSVNKEGKVRGISEWGYDVPLAFKVLVSQEPKIVDSLIWDDPPKIAIRGDYVKGRQKLYEFFEVLEEAGLLADDDRFAGCVKEAKAFLDSPANEGEFFHLENGEVYAMDDRADLSLTELNRLLFERVSQIDKTVKDVLETLKQEPKPEPDVLHLLGIHYWDNILYYDLSGDSDG
jgi:hypothetical protein